MRAYNFGSTGNSPTELLLVVPLDGGNNAETTFFGGGTAPLKFRMAKKCLKFGAI